MLLSLFSLEAIAAKIYKVVDENGNVSFSDQPPANTEAAEVSLPTITNTMDSRALSNKRKALVKRLDSEHAERQQQTAEIQAKREQAKKTLQQAKAALAAAKIPKDTDRIGNAGGGTRLRQEYLDRLQNAEQRYEAALKAYQALR